MEAFDPESEELERGGWAGRDEEAGSDDGGLGTYDEDQVERGPSVRVHEKMRIRAAIEVDKEEYAGKAVRRKELRWEDEGDEDDADDQEGNVQAGSSDSEGDDRVGEVDDAEGEGRGEEEGYDEAERIEEEQDAALVRMVAANRADTAKSIHARNQREISGRATMNTPRCPSFIYECDLSNVLRGNTISRQHAEGSSDYGFILSAAETVRRPPVGGSFRVQSDL